MKYHNLHRWQPRIRLPHLTPPNLTLLHVIGNIPLNIVEIFGEYIMI
jgi:hypothetical protein